MRLIDADALIEDIDGDLTDSIAEGRAIEKIMNAPTIEERKKGKWNCSDDYYETGVCSVCEWDVGEAYADCKKWFKFCPNCGADMRGREDE